MLSAVDVSDGDGVSLMTRNRSASISWRATLYASRCLCFVLSQREYDKKDEDGLGETTDKEPVICLIDLGTLRVDDEFIILIRAEF